MRTSAPQRLTTVHLHGHLGRQFGRKFQFAASTPRQALDLLEANFPEFRQVVLSAQHPFRVTVGRADHRDEVGLNFGLGKARTVHIVPCVGGSNNGPVKMLAGAVLIVVGAIGMSPYGQPFGGATWGPYVMNMGIGMFAGGAAQWLARGANPMQNRDEEGRRASYVFNGVVNTMAQGGCVPVLYGRLRHGGCLISAGVTAEEVDVVGPGTGFRILSSMSLQVWPGDPVRSIELQASGGAAPYTWSVPSGLGFGTPPSWVSLADGTLYVTPPATGGTNHDFSLTCTDSEGAKVTKVFRVAVGSQSGVGGAGGDSGPSQHVPSEAPDSLQSRAVARLLLLLGEGPVHGPVDGLKSVYLDGVPLQNADGSYNFKLLKDPEFRLGMPTQDPLSSWSEVESEQSDGREIKHGSPLTIAVTDTSLDSIRLTLGIPSLCKSQDNGDLIGSYVHCDVEVQASGGTWVYARPIPVKGKATTRYQRSIRVNLREFGPGPWQVRVSRYTEDSASVSLNNKTVLDSYTLIQEAKLTYPNSYLLGLTLDASQFQGIPQVGVESKGRIIRVPSNYDPEARTYSGIWDGTWKLGYTNNPAWAFMDMLTHPRYGLGRFVRLEHVNTASLYQVARYCDGMVSDGRGGTEPRFASNLYLQQPEEAYTLLQNMAGAFRGMSYWGSGSVQVAQDAPSDPVMLFTESNVQDGLFNYQSTSRRNRHNAINVGWNDPEDGYKLKYEYVQDHADIAKSGLRHAEEVAFGCTSQAQAHRWGLWRLYLERDETRLVSFTGGLEGLGIRPGDLFQVQDQSLALSRLGGRILSSDGQTHVLDSAPDVGAGTYRLCVVLPDGGVAHQTVSSINGATVVTEPFQSAPGPMAQWILQDVSVPANEFRALSIREVGPTSYEITGLQHNRAKYQMIEAGWSLGTKPNVPILPALGPVSQLVLSTREVVHEDYVSNVLVASWIAGPGASRYRVDWRRDGGNWTESGSTTNGWELADVTPGVYEVRVTALDAKGAAALAVSKALDLTGSLRDDWITPAEKPALVSQWANVQAEKSGLEALANKAGVDKVPFLGAFQALETYLSSPTTSGWNVVPGAKIYLGQGGWRTWEAKWSNYRVEADKLHHAVSGDILDAIGGLGSDGVIGRSEKSRVSIERARITAKRDSLNAQATNAGVAAWYSSYYRPAYDALYVYLQQLTPSISDMTQDTPVVPATWRQKWSDYYAQEALMEQAISDAIRAKADAALSSAGQALAAVPTMLSGKSASPDNRPSLPNGSYPAGKMIWMTGDNTVWRSTGSAWEAQAMQANAIIGQLIAAQIAANAIGARELAAQIAFITELMVGYAETNGIPTSGVKLDGRPNQVALKIGPGGLQIGAFLLDAIACRALVGIDATPTSSQDFRVVWKGNNDPSVRNGLPNPACIGFQIDDAWTNGTVMHYSCTLKLTQSAASDNLDALQWVWVQVGGQLRKYPACSRIIYNDGVGGTWDAVWEQTIDFTINNGTQAPTSLVVVLWNSYGGTTVNFSRSGSLGLRGSTYIQSSSSGTTTTPTGGGTIGGGTPGPNILTNPAA